MRGRGSPIEVGSPRVVLPDRLGGVQDPPVDPRQVLDGLRGCPAIAERMRGLIGFDESGSAVQAPASVRARSANASFGSVESSYHGANTGLCAAFPRSSACLQRSSMTGFR